MSAVYLVMVMRTGCRPLQYSWIPVATSHNAFRKSHDRLRSWVFIASLEDTSARVYQRSGRAKFLNIGCGGKYYIPQEQQDLIAHLADFILGT